MSKNKHKEEKEEKKEVSEEEISEQEENGGAEAAEEAVPDPKEEEISRLKDQLMRTAAEYDNYRKRTAKERAELTPEITARIVGEFLPVLDSLERALSTECSDANYKTGVQMIYDAFNAALEKLGVEKVPTETFDPSMHQAVQQVEGDGQESGKIASVFQNGYRIGSKVLRFAMVSVVS